MKTVGPLISMQLLLIHVNFCIFYCNMFSYLEIYVLYCMSDERSGLVGRVLDLGSKDH